jgi:hypothetical protein
MMLERGIDGAQMALDPTAVADTAAARAGNDGLKAAASAFEAAFARE